MKTTRWPIALAVLAIVLASLPSEKPSFASPFTTFREGLSTGFAAAADSCPINHLGAQNCSVWTREPSRGLTCQGEFGGIASASYNLVTAQVYVIGGGGDFGGYGSVYAIDEYQVSGVAPGTPLAFTANLTIRAIALASSHCGGFGSAFATATLQEEGSSNAAQFSIDSSASPTCSVVLDSTLTIVIENHAGEPFRLGLIAAAGGTFGDGSVSGSLSFTNLPPGSQVTSCQGFMQGFPVSVVLGTWGSLKSRYR